MSKRKKVFDTSEITHLWAHRSQDEIAHLWAHQSQDSARNQQGNFYFSGGTIYSYGSHFPIARHVTNKAGAKAVLFTTCTRSTTTARHISLVRRSIPSSVQVFEVERPKDEPKTLFAAMVKDIGARIKAVAEYAPKPKYVSRRKLEQREIKLANIEAPVEALCGRNLAVHEHASATRAGATRATRRGYTLTHIATGLAVDRDIESKTQAVMMLEVLDGLKEWAQVTSADIKDVPIKTLETLHSALWTARAKSRIKAAKYASGERVHPATVTKAWRALESAIEDANKFAVFFGFRKRFNIPSRLEFARVIANDYDAKANVRSERAQAAARTRSAIWHAEWNARYEATQKYQSKTPQERLEAWLNGESIDTYMLPRHNGAYLRIHNEEVQTSMGAVVPISHARRALGFVRGLKAKGETYKHSDNGDGHGHTFHIGVYALDAVDIEGNITAGCHRIMWAEVERFGAVLDTYGASEVSEVTNAQQPQEQPQAQAS